MRTEYEDVEAGEWVQPSRTGYLMQCCDCGLIHKLDFRIKNGRIQFRCDRDERRTAAVRRWRRVRGETIALKPVSG